MACPLGSAARHIHSLNVYWVPKRCPKTWSERPHGKQDPSHPTYPCWAPFPLDMPAECVCMSEPRWEKQTNHPANPETVISWYSFKSQSFEVACLQQQSNRYTGLFKYTKKQWTIIDGSSSFLRSIYIEHMFNVTKTLKLELIKVLQHTLITSTHSFFGTIFKIISYPKALLKGMCWATEKAQSLNHSHTSISYGDCDLNSYI